MTARPRPRPGRRAGRAARPAARARSRSTAPSARGGHARLVAERLGPDGHADRHRPRPARPRSASPSSPPRSPCRTRFIRAPFAEALEELRDEGVRADLVYLDLGMSSMQVDTRERGFSYAYDAPLDMRMDPTQELDAPPTSSTTWDERRLARVLRDFGEERYADQIARAIVRERARGADRRRRTSSSTSSRTAIPARRASPAATRPSAPSRRCASRSTTSSASSTRALPLAWAAPAHGTADLQGSRSTRWKTAA